MKTLIVITCVLVSVVCGSFIFGAVVTPIRDAIVASKAQNAEKQTRFEIYECTRVRNMSALEIVKDPSASAKMTDCLNRGVPWAQAAKPKPSYWSDEAVAERMKGKSKL